MPHVGRPGGEPAGDARRQRASMKRSRRRAALVVLHLEELDAVPAPFDAMLSTLLPLGAA